MATFRLAAFDRLSPLCRAFLLLYTLPAETLISKDLLIKTANSQYSGVFFFVVFFCLFLPRCMAYEILSSLTRE